MSWLWSFPDAPEPVPQNVAFPDHFVGRLGALVGGRAARSVDAPRGHARAHHIEIVQAEMALNLLSDLFLKESLEPGLGRPSRQPVHAGGAMGRLPLRGGAALVRHYVSRRRANGGARGSTLAIPSGLVRPGSPRPKVDSLPKTSSTSICRDGRRSAPTVT